MSSPHPVNTQHSPARLPHAYPFLLLDRVLMIEPDRWAVALKNVSRDDALLDTAGALPPSLLAEAMAQTAGLAVVTHTGESPAALLVQIDRFRCRPPVCGGAQLLVTARVLRRFGKNVKVRASISVAGRRRAAAELVLHFETPALRQR